MGMERHEQDKQNRQDRQDSALVVRQGVGLSARVGQRRDLRFSRIVVDRPALIVVTHGTKTLHADDRQWSIRGGEGVAIAGGQTFDVSNRLSDDGLYEARWLIWDPAIVAGFDRWPARIPPLAGAASLGRIDTQLAGAFERAVDAIQDVEHVPDEVARHRLAEVLVWLSLRGIRFAPADTPGMATKVRRLFETALDRRWTAAAVASDLAVSEATLRRRLAAEGTALGAILADVRMSFAMVLLQSTRYPVQRIALEVGYESASRFAIRFRERFGFPPTAIRRC